MQPRPMSALQPSVTKLVVRLLSSHRAHQMNWKGPAIGFTTLATPWHDGTANSTEPLQPQWLNVLQHSLHASEALASDPPASSCR